MRGASAANAQDEGGLLRALQCREFVAPLPLAGVVLMAVNDAWLKPAFHNSVTGKLSDFAICTFLPFLVSACLGLLLAWRLRVRLALGAAATALVFTALKTSPWAVARFLEALAVVGRPLGYTDFRAVVDPTDLVALPLVLLALRAPQPRKAVL